MSTLEFSCELNTASSKQRKLLGELIGLVNACSVAFDLNDRPAEAELPSVDEPEQEELHFEFATAPELQPSPPKRKVVKRRDPDRKYRKLAAPEVVKTDKVGHSESCQLLLRSGRNLYLTCNGFAELCGVDRASFNYHLKKGHELGFFDAAQITRGRRPGLCAPLKPVYNYLRTRNLKFQLPALRDMQAVVDDWVAEAR